jgi:hypothetical protein
VFRDETPIKNQLLGEMSNFLRTRAEDHKTLVKEQGRQEIRNLVENWLRQKKQAVHSIEVVFQSESQLETDTPI